MNEFNPEIYKCKEGVKKKMSKKLVEKNPECYSPNDNPYPLCIGNGSEDCKKCCIYEDMEEPPFDK